jgi:hypothetical protein
MKNEKTRCPPVFASADDWQNNACIPQFGGKEFAYIEGYRLAADTLVEHVKETGRCQDFLVFPIVYLYRHYLELLLKQIIADGRELLDNKTGFPTHHRLTDLWTEAKGLTRRTWRTHDPPEMREVDHVISEFARLDPEGESFRYAVKKDGQSTLPPIQHINLRQLSDSLRVVSQFLDGVSTGISVYLDNQREMSAYYRSG